MVTCRIHITGLVQGVGFRPFIYRIATELNVKGTVENRSDGVYIIATAPQDIIDEFISLVKKTAPPASEIYDLKTEIPGEIIHFTNFTIVKSSDAGGEITEISPDIAVCKDCQHDMKTMKHRIDYPFINCTNCGPRFTIIKNLPYDREMTTMAEFEMCHICKSEYTDISDRRFHAQPIACNNCGPHYTLLTDNKEIAGINEIILKLQQILEKGDIAAVKGAGGYFLTCNALDENAVSTLRKRKHRDSKPFAVMFRDIQTAEKYCNINEKEAKELRSWRRPIVLLGQKQQLAPSVCNGINSTGSMLPYLPVHYQIFENSKLEVLVMTSGNISDEPIIISDNEAISKLCNIADAILTNNREIYNRCDDSVTFVANSRSRIIRRSRGFVPNPLRMNFLCEGILATGAELKTTFCIGKNNQAILSQHIGDLKNFETLEFYKESIERFCKLFRFKPELIACDLHPDYLSSIYADELKLPVIKVQHHHAHIASVLAENNINEKVIGVSFDGTGLGDDNAIWGSEFLICDLSSYQRYAHFDYTPMPGGDAAANQPWRMAVSYLYKYYGNKLFDLKIPFLDKIEHNKIQMLILSMENSLNSPPTSSCGRLFDAIAALTGICLNHSYEAEGPMRLQSVIDNVCKEQYGYDYSNNIIHFNTMFDEITRDILANINISKISAKFHNTIINSIINTCKKASVDTGIKTIALSGGVFQNSYILGITESLLENKGFNVLSNYNIPANDGGIALGQLAVAARM